MIIGMPPPSGARSRLLLAGVQDFVVDDAHKQIFITGSPEDSVILVANYQGEIVKRIEGEPGATFMELVGNSLYVSLRWEREIHEFDTATLEKVATYETGEDVEPAYLARVGNYLWFSHACGGGGEIGSLDLTTGFVETFDVRPSGTCPDLSSVPGNETQLFIYDPQAYSPVDPVIALDVVAGRVIRERGEVPGAGAVVFDESGETFVTCANQRVQRYQTSDLAPLEKIDVPCTSGLDMSPDGETIATVAHPPYRFAIHVVRGTKRYTWTGQDLAIEPGVGVTPDGKRVFVTTGGYYGKVEPTHHLSTLLPPTTVLASKAFEYLPRGDGDYLTWTQRKSYRAGNNAVFVRKAGGKRVKVNARGTEGFWPGIDGSLIAYQQTRGLESDIFLYDAGKRRRRSAGRRVNSRAWEYYPSLSRPWLLFARGNRSFIERRMMLANLKTGRVLTLDRMRSRSPCCMTPGQVNGRYATWVKCTSRCDVFRYDIASRKRIRVPNPKVEDSFGSSVTDDGTVYFGRGPGGCGRDIRLMKYSDGRVSLVTDLPHGRDFFTTFARTGGPETTLYLDALTCPDDYPRKGLRSDVLSIEGV